MELLKWWALVLLRGTLTISAAVIAVSALFLLVAHVPYLLVAAGCIVAAALVGLLWEG
jgi:hypothetical protein